MAVTICCMPDTLPFFKTASQYGKLYVSVGQDENLFRLKGKKPYFSQEERVYMVGAIKYVTEAFVSSGMGMLDFEEDMKRLKPELFIVNTDGFTEGKARICKENNVELVVLERIPEEGLPARSSSSSKKELQFPYRVLSCRRLDGSTLGFPKFSSRIGSGCSNLANHRVSTIAPEMANQLT